MKLNSRKKKEIRKEIEKIYFHKVLKKLVGEWMKISSKIKNN